MPYKDPLIKAQKNREYLKRHYAQNKLQYYERNRARVRACQEFLLQFKTGQRCMDCQGLFPPKVLDFDHRDPTMKCKEVAKLVVGGNLKAVKREIEKCDLICANCHRIRTYHQESGIV